MAKYPRRVQCRQSDRARSDKCAILIDCGRLCRSIIRNRVVLPNVVERADILAMNGSD